MKISSCPLCFSDLSRILYEKNGNYYIVQCLKCKHIYTKIDKEVNLEKLYSEGDYASFDSRNTIFEKIIDYNNNKKLKK